MEKTVFEIVDVSYNCLMKFPALCGVNLKIMERERIALLGANGSGKSSLLNLLNGLAFPQKGMIKFLGQNLSEEALMDKEFNGFFRKTVGFVFQNSDIQLFSPTVWDEIAFGPIQLGLSERDVAGRVDELMEMLYITNLKDRAPYQLSGGEKKKVAIAATLAVNPDVLLLDEPTNGLDPRTQAELVDFLQELYQMGKTIIISTHDLNIARMASDRAIVLNEAHTVETEGPTRDILDNT